jgi:hypothetical protein
MLKLTVAVLALAVATSASAAGWRSLRVDGSSEQAFEKSLEAFQDKLSPARQHVFGEALKDIYAQGTQAAAAEQREYTTDEYYRQLDGLRYEEVVKFTDPTGDTAKDRYRAASLAARRAHPTASVSYPAPGPRPTMGRGWSPGGGFNPGGPQGN